MKRWLIIGLVLGAMVLSARVSPRSTTDLASRPSRARRAVVTVDMEHALWFDPARGRWMPLSSGSDSTHPPVPIAGPDAFEIDLPPDTALVP